VKKVCLILAVMLVIGITGYTVADDCITVKQRVIPYPAGHYFTTTIPVQFISPGYDDFGYNYQAHMFNGYYANAYLGKEGFPPYEGDDVAYLDALTDTQRASVQLKWYWPHREITLMMKWSDVWLSNKDCDADGLLDRGYPCDNDNPVSSACEGAWLTNHQSGTCTDLETGKEHRWTYFVKIIYPTDATVVDKEGVPFWYVGDVEIGKVLWGAYAIIQQVDNDACLGLHGISYRSPAGPGFGKEW